MRLLRTIGAAFGLYSRIPVPHFEWEEDDMKYSMAAFPLVGAVIGAVFFAVFRVCAHFEVPSAAAALILTAVPLIITGGFHADGFMDVSDAVSSFKSREEKLAILKDPHIGAFAVIRLAICGLIYIASLIIVLDSGMAEGLMISIASGFMLARGMSAVSVLTLRSAKKEGMLYNEAESAADGRRVNLVFAFLFIAASAMAMTWFAWPAGIGTVIAAVLSFAWYKHLSYKEFGGITGDTAGYFVVVCEAAIAAGAAVCALIAG